jgi:2-haloacid dehalogenase
LRILYNAAVLPRYRLITLDVYTALFDLESSLGPRLAQAAGLELQVARRLANTWHVHQLTYYLISNSLTQGRVPGRLALRRALDVTLGEAQVDCPEPERDALVAAWDALDPWPETGEVLTVLSQRGYSLALLSNGDEASLRALAVRLPAPMAGIFAGDQAGVYKPHPALYALPLKALNLPAEAILHVAGSPGDTLGARAAGLDCYWSNRRRKLVYDPAFRATYEYPDLRGLLAILPAPA